LDAVRKQQKQMIKDKTAAVGATEWTIDGSKSKGKAFINANIKQILRSFNNETEVIISKVKHSNLESSKNRIQKSYDVLNNLYTREQVHLTQGYLNLKFDEMYLAYEYEVKKQEEKEELREAIEREREEKKLQKELEREKKKFERENETITSEIEEAKAKMAQAAAEEKAKLEAEIAKLQAALDKNNEEVKKINEWKEKPGAGYVYIISNIGSFGEGVFKIGVTRRDNPEDRIRELSSASVPFSFDTHVFIFSKNAYDLESELHERFNDKRVNKVNMRKEFFRIGIEDVKKIVEENKGQVHSFVEHPDAEEYYDTLKIERQRLV
jgi:flagellar biosynthesis GTPase FlhF